MHRIGMMTEFMYRVVGTKKALKIMKDLGFECADITIQEEGEARHMNRYFAGKNYLKRAKELKEYADQIGLPLVQAHAPFPSFIIGQDRFNKKEWSNIIKSIEICGVLKIKNLVIHPINDYPDNLNIEFYQKLLPIAKKNNVVICCENMWRWNKEIDRAKPCSCSFSDSFNAIIDGVNDDNLKACVDIGHAEMFKHMGYSPKKMLLEMGNRVVCLHIHDNDSIHDRHQIPFEGNINYEDVAKALKDINYQGDFIAEIILDRKTLTSYSKRAPYYKKLYDAMVKFKAMFDNVK